MELNNFEYGAMKKNEGAIKKRKMILLAVYVIFTGAAFGAVIASKLLPVGAIVPFLLYILVLATWRYTQVDYKYIIETGTLTLTRKYGNSKAKELVKFRIKSAELIAPMRDSEGKIRDFEPEVVYDALPSVACEDAYVILFRDDNNARCAMYIEVSEASLKALRYYNENCVMSKTQK